MDEPSKHYTKWKSQKTTHDVIPLIENVQNR